MSRKTIVCELIVCDNCNAEVDLYDYVQVKGPADDWITFEQGGHRMHYCGQCNDLNKGTHDTN